MNTYWGEILWLVLVGGMFFLMVRRGGCCGGHHQRRKDPVESGQDDPNREQLQQDTEF